MKNHGITGLHLVGKIFADDGRKSDVDGIPEKDPGKGFGNDSLYAQSLQDAGSLLS